MTELLPATTSGKVHGVISLTPLGEGILGSQS